VDTALEQHGAPAAAPLAILVERLTKRFGAITAVDDISFMVPQGEFFGFLGPNGAGKTTTLRVLCGLTRAQYQRISIAGRDLASDPLGVKASIGVMLEDPVLYERLSAREHLIFTGQMYGLNVEQATARTEELLGLLGLTPDANRLIIDFSQGMRKKVALGCALIHNPPVLFLDEPFNGIDTVSSHQIKDMLRAMAARGVTILFSSHVMEVVEKLCTGLAIIDRGRIVLAETMASLRARAGYTGLEEIFINAVGEGAVLCDEESGWLAG
jgi:ABC-2 type transport system ATP-binding protein